MKKQAAFIIAILFSGGWFSLFAAESVDLGLSVKWASANVGASAPREQGALFAWGAVKSVAYYEWSTYPLCKGHFNELTKYNIEPQLGVVDGKTVLEKDDDAAAVVLGDGWRIPTEDEWKELINECEWTFSLAGCTVRSRKAGFEDRSIFLPFVASKSGGEVHSSKMGYYWTANLAPRSCWSAVGVSFYEDRVEFPVFGRYLGCAIRAVKDE